MTLDEATTQMQALLDEVEERGGDLEAAHGEKDKLLAQVVREHLGAKGRNLADLYESIGGWYA